MVVNEADAAVENRILESSCATQQMIRTSRSQVIDSPPSEVWPWLVQMGQGRGGFYSYTWLENLLGCEMVNADRILDEYQSLRVGDEVPLHPTAQPLEVLEVSPPSHLCLGQRISRGKSLVAKWTWDFRVELHQDQGVHESKRSILEVETRIWLPNFCLRWGLGLPIRLGHSLMEAKMLRGIRSRVEKNQST